MRPLSRRTVLRGLGLAGIGIALPPLEAMVTRRGRLFYGDAQADGTLPKRFVLFHFPNGAHMEDWIPAGEGTAFTLPSILSPLESYKMDLNVVSGLSCLARNVQVDGLDGGHNNANLAFLTGTVGGANGASSISVDQLAAQHIGGGTKASSVVAALFHYGDVRNCRMWWSAPETPVTPQTEPQALFDSLFAGSELTESQAALLRARRQSVLDCVKADIDDLNRVLSASDRQRLDVHLTSVRELEKAIQALGNLSCSTPQAPVNPGTDDAQLALKAELMVDLVAMALACDVTRVLCYSMGNTNNTTTYPFISVPYADHEVSHYNAISSTDEPDATLRKQQNDELYRKMTRWKMELFARLLGKLKGTPEGTGTLLDHCIVACVSEMSNGDWHSSHNLPVLVAGGGMQTGRHIRFPCDPATNPTGKWCLDNGGANTPLSNLWLTMLQAVGAPVQSFGESTGTLSGLWI